MNITQVVIYIYCILKFILHLLCSNIYINIYIIPKLGNPAKQIRRKSTPTHPLLNVCWNLKDWSAEEINYQTFVFVNIPVVQYLPSV